MRARGVGGRTRHGLLGFLDAIPPRLINEASALAAACVLAQEGNAAAAEVVLTLARDYVAETRMVALLDGPARPVVVEPGDLLPTHAAARRLGCSPYELRERHRRGEIAAMQAKRRGPLLFEATELERYRAAHTLGRLTSGLDQRYASGHDKKRRMGVAAQAQNDTSAARRGARGDGNDGCAVGARAPRRRPAGDGCPVAPNASAWATRPPWGDDAADPPPGEG